MTGFTVREHRVEVPVDWSAPDRFGSIEVFARELVDPEKASDDLPLLLFLQGGPGGQGPRPLGGGWVAAALERYRVILLDQRGTGRSSPVDGRVISGVDDPAGYLACFRGDAVVADAEHLRSTVYGGRQWATLGQSYGGFLTLTYLSRHPAALTRCFVTGGLPPATVDAEAVYAATFRRQAARNRELARLHPDDVPLLGQIADLLADGSVVLPTGEPFTPERLQQLGHGLGMSTGIDEVHWLLDTALTPAGTSPTRSSGPWSARPGSTATRCTRCSRRSSTTRAPASPAGRHRPSATGGRRSTPARARCSSPARRSSPGCTSSTRALRPFRAAAEALAARQEWPALYDLDRLAANEVPVAAVQYYDDPYVDLDLALATPVGNLDVWITNEHLHDGLRVAGDTILPRLFDVAAGKARVTGR